MFLQSGEADSAEEVCAGALRRYPDDANFLCLSARALLLLERFEEANARIEGALSIYPEFERAHEVRGELLLAKGELTAAEDLFRQILTRDPDNIGAKRLWARLVAVRAEQQQFDDAIESARRLIELIPHSPDAHILLASVSASVERHQEAIESFDKALDIAPNHVAALCGKGHSYRTMGNQDGAIAAFRKSIKSNPLFAEPYWSLANMRTFRFEDAEVDDMLALVGDERIAPKGQVQLNNALGLEFDGRKEYDRAFQFIDRGNKLQREQEFYDRVENEEMVDRLIETFSQPFLNGNSGHGDPEPAPIFIVGLPRSGSTLIEQILSSHSRVDGTHELRDLALTILSSQKLSGSGAHYPEYVTHIDADSFMDLGSEYIERTLRHRGDRPFFTDKSPNNYVHVGLLHLVLPNAKIINARRHPLDSCFGSYKQLFTSGRPFTYDLIELGQHYVQYQRLMDHWHDVLPGKVLDVHYEEVVADLEGQVRRILEYCGLGWEESCLNFHESSRAVKTPSSEQVRQPIYESAVNYWRHYEQHLGPLIEVLEPLLAKLPESDRPL